MNILTFEGKKWMKFTEFNGKYPVWLSNKKKKGPHPSR